MTEGGADRGLMVRLPRRPLTALVDGLFSSP
jgi:hypothetical protein